MGFSIQQIKEADYKVHVCEVRVMDLYELWRARAENRFTVKHYIYAWIISARLFAVPWITLFTLFGVLLAGVVNIERAIASILVTVFLTIAAHFNNNYKDVELGVDRFVESPEEARSVISTIKPYTAAAWIVPLKITSIRFQKANEYLFIALAVAVYLLFFSGDMTILLLSMPILALGVALARTYTSFFKRNRLGELALFLGHGFGTVAFGFISQKPDILMAFLSGVPTGLISGLVYGIDQFVDIRSDFIRRVRSIYESWFNSRMPLGLYLLITMAFWYNVIVTWVVAGIYPRGVLIVLATLPIVLFIAPQLEYDRYKALGRAVLLATFLIPLLMCLGVLIR